MRQDPEVLDEVLLTKSRPRTWTHPLGLERVTEGWVCGPREDLSKGTDRVSFG